MTQLIDTYRVTRTDYDQSTDFLTADIYLHASPDFEETDAPERAEIRARVEIDFSEALSSISFVTHIECNSSYPATVLAAFARTFEKAYDALDPSSSPAEVAIDSFEAHY